MANAIFWWRSTVWENRIIKQRCRAVETLRSCSQILSHDLKMVLTVENENVDAEMIHLTNWESFYNNNICQK